MKRALHATGLALSVTLAPAVFAQSGPGMMLVPWQGELQAQFKADAFFTPTEADVTGADVDLSIYNATGRFRLDPDASYNPTIGFELIQYDFI